MIARHSDKTVREPVPYRGQAVVFTPWKRGKCEWCGREDWLRYWTPSRLFECFACWLGHRDRTNGSHGYEDDARLAWLWKQVSEGAL